MAITMNKKYSRVKYSWTLTFQTLFCLAIIAAPLYVYSVSILPMLKLFKTFMLK